MQLAYNVTDNSITTDNILLYHLQKLQEVGYRNITIVNSTYATVNITNPQTHQTLSIVPAKTVEMTYRTSASALNEIRRGYFILTATNATSPNPGVTKGYSIFYEGISTIAPASTVQTTTSTTPLSGGLPDPPAVVRRIFDSFELIAAPDVIRQDMLAAQSQRAQQEVTENEEEPTSPLTAEIVTTTTEGVAPATILFEADAQGGTEPYTSYSWNFGDGSQEMIDEDAATTHTFEEAGSYDVVLTITDSDGRTASDSVAITITAGEEPPAATSEGEEVVAEEEQQPPEEGAGEDLLVCIRGGGPPREAELTLEEVERSLELGVAERITIGPCPSAD